MDLKLYPVEDLLAELIRRDAIKIAQISQRIPARQLMTDIAHRDVTRAMELMSTQAQIGAAIAKNMDVQMLQHRKVDGTGDEEVRVTVMLASQDAMKRLTALQPPSPDVEVPA